MLTAVAAGARRVVAPVVLLAALWLLWGARSPSQPSVAKSVDPVLTAAVATAGLGIGEALMGDVGRDRLLRDGVALDLAGTLESRAPLVPASLLQLPPSVVSAMVIDVDSNTLHVFENLGRSVAKTGELYVAIGKGGAGKQREGDERTPIGIYSPSSFIPDERLPEIYGRGAFPIDYPNAWDQRRGRSGSGIWIHGTNKGEGELLARSSRGCITLSDADLLRLMEYLQLGRTPVVISHGLTWQAAYEVEATRRSLSERVEQWRRDWESLDTERYIRHYASSFHVGSMDLAAFRRQKMRVNASKSFVAVELGDLSMYSYPGEDELYLVTFEQRYKSDNFRAVRTKYQYWQRRPEGWRIVEES